MSATGEFLRKVFARVGYLCSAQKTEPVRLVERPAHFGPPPECPDSKRERPELRLIQGEGRSAKSGRRANIQREIATPYLA